MQTRVSVIDGRTKPRPGIEAQKQVILDAAVDLFTQQGSHAVSISQICTSAEVSRPTFYRCFVDKDALLEEIYERSVFQIIEADLLQGLTQMGGDLKWLRRTLDSVLDSIFANPRYAALIFAESALPDSRAHEIVDAAFERACAVIRSWIKAVNGSTVDKQFLKAVMAACQWIAHDAIRRGLSAAKKRQAKDAMWELVSRLYRSIDTKAARSSTGLRSPEA